MGDFMVKLNMENGYYLFKLDDILKENNISYASLFIKEVWGYAPKRKRKKYKIY